MMSPLTYALPVVAMLVAMSPASGKTHSAGRALNDSEIHAELNGKLISYSPPDTADAGVSEEFHEGGIWRGMVYSRGPIPFSGRWAIHDRQLCVIADPGTSVGRWFIGTRCRAVKFGDKSGELLIENLDPSYAAIGPLKVSPKELQPLGY